MAVELTFTIASRRFKIFGSGTCSTLTSCLPYQQFALITFPFLKLTTIQISHVTSTRDSIRSRSLRLSEFFRRGGLRGALRQQAVVPDRAVRNDDLADFHHLLQAMKIVINLLPRLFTEELGDRLANDSARR